jgi:ankyrin repeat protein
MSVMNEIINDFNIKNNDGNTPLHMAIRKSNEDMIFLLVNSGADVNISNKKGKTPIHMAFEFFDVNDGIAYFLLMKTDKINEVDGDGNTYLHKAVLAKDYKVIKKLLEKNCNVNIYNCKEKTPLHYIGDNFPNYVVDILHLFIKHNVNVDTILCKSNCTLLHIAVSINDKTLVELLLNKKCKCNITDENGMTPIHMAVDENNMDMLKLLLKKD